MYSGLMTPEELNLYLKTASKRDTNWWIPFQWAYTLLFRAQQEGKLTEGSMMRLHDVSYWVVIITQIYWSNFFCYTLACARFTKSMLDIIFSRLDTNSNGLYAGQ